MKVFLAQMVVAAKQLAFNKLKRPLVYGPHAPGNFGLLVRAVQRDWPLPLGAIHNQRSIVGVDVLCEAIIESTTNLRAANQLFLLAEGDSTPRGVIHIHDCLRAGIA